MIDTESIISTKIRRMHKMYEFFLFATNFNAERYSITHKRKRSVWRPLNKNRPDLEGFPLVSLNIAQDCR